MKKQVTTLGSKSTSKNSNHGLQTRSLVLGLSIGLAIATSISTVASTTNGNVLSNVQNNLNSVNGASTTVGNSYTNTITSNIPTITSSPFMADDNSAAAQSAIDGATVGCGDPNTQGSIAWTQQEVIKNRQILNTAPVDIDALFNGSSGGSSGSSCFSDITKLIDLSVVIPDFSGMKAAAIAALRAYATRKVCTMVNEATKKALEPLNNAIDIINKNGTIDLNGAVQGSITGGLGKLDPELADIYKTQAPQGQNVTVFPTDQTTFNNDLKNVQDSVNGAINGISTPNQNQTGTGSTGTTWNNSNNPTQAATLQTTPVENLQAQQKNNSTNQSQPASSGSSKSSIFDSIFN